MTTRGEMKVLDFGLAVVRPPVNESISRLETALTAPGTLVGTCGYMSPEQVRGDDVDHRTDIFSFGIVLYEMLAGRHPFLRKSSVETMSAILRDAPPAPWLPAGLERLIGRCLAKEPGERWSTVAELKTGLREASNPGGVLGRLIAWLRRT